MTAYDAKMNIVGEDPNAYPVVVDLTDGRLTMTLGDEQVADWSRNDMRVQALPDGFHIQAEGEAIVLDVSDKARFALELGLRSAYPELRQKMAALMRSDDVEPA